MGAEVGAAHAAEGGLLGEDVWYIEDALGGNQAAAIALIEHRWVTGLREAGRSIGLLQADEVQAQLFGGSSAG